jgi:hypothetical protein
MSHRTLLGFALHWNHKSAACREAAGLPHVTPHPALFRSALGALHPRFSRGTRAAHELDFRSHEILYSTVL